MTPAPVGLRCPEHSGKPQGIRKVTTPAQRAVTGVGSRRTNIVTLTLIGMNVAVYLAELALGGNAGNGTGNTIYEHGALYGPLVAAGDWWRIGTAAFLHYGPIHLALNMWGLYIAGTLLEQVIGRWRFALLYFASGIAGSAGALLVTFYSPTVGASGAIFGVFGALLVLERKRHISTGGQILAIVILNLVFTFAVPGISIGGHVGGLLSGAVLMLLMLQYRSSALMSIVSTVGVVIVAAVVSYAKVRGYQ
jgi:membrane associated rhomboid family serine protease